MFREVEKLECYRLLVPETKSNNFIFPDIKVLFFLRLGFKISLDFSDFVKVIFDWVFLTLVTVHSMHAKPEDFEKCMWGGGGG